MRATTSRPVASGFTLIELLVVISILALLVVTFLPDIVSALGQSKTTDTGARIILLENGIDAFERQSGHGYYPPSDFKDPQDKLKLRPDNGINTGIESLVVFLSQNGGVNLSEHPGWLANTDKDDNGAMVPLLDTTERKEFVDAWDNPFAYFSSTSAGSFEQPQKIRLANDGGDVVATAWKGPGGYFGVRKYQLLSAGKDQVFNTEDDISFPERK